MAEHAFVDSSFFAARFNVRDRDHRAAVAFLEEQRGTGADALRLVSSDYVFDETLTALLTGRRDPTRSPPQVRRF
jgi:predicted nucleic acid-binding protein